VADPLKHANPVRYFAEFGRSESRRMSVGRGPKISWESWGGCAPRNTLLPTCVTLPNMVVL